MTVAVATAPARRLRAEQLLAPALALTVAVVASLLGWRGVDLPAQLFRVAEFRKSGFTLWDNQWYGGHFTLPYSVLFPPFAAWLGATTLTVLSATAAAWGFDRLAVMHFGTGARVGSLLFALGTAVQIAIGQLPFLLGEALALCAFLAATRRRLVLSILLAMATTLASPLAGAFLALAAAAWLATTWPRAAGRIVALGAAAVGPILVLDWLFPGAGTFPYPRADFLWEALAVVGLLVLIPRRERALRVAAGLYLAATVGSFFVASPIGGNVGRLGECLAIPIVACLLWPARRTLLAVVAIPIAFWQWTPAVAAMTQNAREPSAQASYYAPLLDFLRAHAEPPARVEVVPTSLHWETAYVAPQFPLARGWERQLDTQYNPIFYDSDEDLTPATYLAWLRNAGVRYVALPDAPLDFAAVGEGRLITAGVDGLTPVWRTAHWQVYEVSDSAGIVDGSARLVSLTPDRITLSVNQPGSVLVRVHYNPHWQLTGGPGCVRPDAGGWTVVDASATGLLTLDMHLLGTATAPC